MRAAGRVPGKSFHLQTATRQRRLLASNFTSKYASSGSHARTTRTVVIAFSSPGTIPSPLARLASLPHSSAVDACGTLRNRHGSDGDYSDPRSGSGTRRTRDHSRTTGSLALLLGPAPGPQCSPFHCTSTDPHAPPPYRHLCYHLW